MLFILSCPVFLLAQIPISTGAFPFYPMRQWCYHRSIYSSSAASPSACHRTVDLLSLSTLFCFFIIFIEFIPHLRYLSLSFLFSRHHLSSPRQSQGYCCLFCLQFLFITSFCFTRGSLPRRRRRCRLLLLPFRLLHAHLSAEEAKREGERERKRRVLFSAFFIIIQTPLVNLKRCRPSLAESSSFSTLNFAF